MTRFVAALLVAAGGPVRIQVDPHIPRPHDCGPLRAAALLAQAHQRGRAQRRADDALMAELATAMREVPGEDKARDAGRKAWQQQRGGRDA